MGVIGTSGAAAEICPGGRSKVVLGPYREE
jgi:hypothetical protein